VIIHIVLMVELHCCLLGAVIRVLFKSSLLVGISGEGGE